MNPEHYTSELKPPATPPSFTLWMSPLFRTRCSTSCTPSQPPPPPTLVPGIELVVALKSLGNQPHNPHSFSESVKPLPPPPPRPPT